MSSSSEFRVAVVDNGSGVVKCGYVDSSRNFPEHVFPSIVGRPLARSAKYIDAGDVKDILVGDECTNNRRFLDVSYPMENGVIRNWDDMYHVWDHTFGEERLNLDPQATKLMLTEPSINSSVNRIKVIETMFEKYGFNSLYIGTQAVMALYARGLNTGVCVDSGDGVTHICPVFEGQILTHLSQRLNVAGRHITTELSKLLLMRGHAFNHSADFEVLRELKEKLCYVAYDTKVDERLIEETTVLNTNYQLPDGKSIILAEELFRAPEILFKPSLLGHECPGVAEMLYNCVRGADIDLRQTLFKNILVTGGTTMLPGFPERLEKDINELYLKKVLQGNEERMDRFKARVDAPPKRQHLVYNGACLFARLIEREQPDMWISIDDYEDDGLVRCMDKLNLHKTVHCIN